MSTTIDSKVVEMRFDNKNFEQNASNTMSTLDKLKQRLNMDGATKGLEDVQNASRRIDFSAMGGAVDTIQAKFSALQVVGITAISNLANSAVNAGKRIVSALTIDPIKTGFQEYETQINSVQTILANTESKGSTLKDVNNALDTLNTYADKTIYNFTEMTRNIGTFTAAGVDLDTSVSSIQGIANLAAISGSTSQQASTAMYQLSQALAAGKVSLMDWNSVVNAGMGGQVFQDALIRTSEAMGTGAKDAIDKFGSFRESLTQGEWLTTDVLTKTLEQFTMAAEEGSEEWKEFKKSLMDDGYTEKQAEEILKMANTATNAATKVKTFTQLWDTLKEAAQSGWTQTWEIIVGDFEEAKETLTKVSDAIGAIIGKSAEARNELLKGWKELGGRSHLVDGIANIFNGFKGVVEAIGKAFREIFPAMTANQLFSVTEGFKKLTEGFKLSEDTLDKIQRTFRGLFSVISVFAKLFGAVGKGIFTLLNSGALGGILNFLLGITATIGDMLTAITGGFDGNVLSKLFSGISEVIGGVVTGLTGFTGSLSDFGNSVADVVGTIWNAIKTAFGWIKENIDFGDIFLGLTGGGIFLAAKKLAGMFDSIGGLFEGGLLKMIFGDGGGGDVVKFKDILGSANESLIAFTGGIKIGSLLAIAAAIAILSASLETLSGLSAVDITKSLIAVGVMFKMLTVSFTSLNKSLSMFAGKGIIRTGIALMMMAKSIDILADAMTKMAGLSLKQIAKGLLGIGGSMAALVIGLKAINSVKIKITTIIALGALANALKSMATTLAELGKMSWGEIARGLTAMGGALMIFMGTLKIMEKVASAKSLVGAIGLVIAVKSLDGIASALSKLGELSWGEIARGLAAMTAALAVLAGITGVLGKLSGISGIIGGMALVAAAQSLEYIAKALETLGILSWGEIGRGLTAMTGALAVLGVITGLLGKLAGVSGLVGAVTILLVAKSLDDIAKALMKFGSMSWGEIARGLVAMGAALLELGVIVGLLGTFAGVTGLVGATAILIVTQALDDISAALVKFGSMSWGEIARGLTAMGGALAELAITVGMLGTFGGLASIVGAGSILLVSQGLGDIADALIKFGTMPWDQVKTGLAAMGLALAELAVGGVLNTLSIIGAASISTMAEPLGILADSMKKWSDVKIPLGLGLQLGILAAGVTAFTLSGLGANAISEVAKPLGVMAESVKKWANVTVPEDIGTTLGTLADGVKSFTLSGLGAGAIAEVAEPLGALAGSVKKWASVTVPEGLSGQLKTLAEGVKGFTFGGSGAKSIGEVAEPLGVLAGSVKKWASVTVPEGLSGQLKTLAEGVKGFTFGGSGAKSLSGVAEPLGVLADSVNKWAKTTVPEDMGDKLKDLADGIKSFSGANRFKKIAGSTETLASALKKLSEVKIGSIGNKLKEFGNSLSTFNDSVGDVSGVGEELASNITTPIKNLKTALKDTGGNLIDSLANGLKSNKAATNAAKTVATNINNAITSKTSELKSAGTKLGTNIANGIKSKQGAIKDAFTKAVNKGLNAVNDCKSDFKDAGKNLGQGLINGINAKKTAAYNAGYALGQKSAQGVKDGSDEHSPSKLTYQYGIWQGEGLINGIFAMGKKAYNAGFGLGNTAATSMSDAISKITDGIDTNMDLQPTIRPVLDLDDVKSGAGLIGSMLNTSPSVGVMGNLGSISTTMARRNQNGTADVISAINKLGKGLDKVGNNTTYNVNGITSNSSDVNSAIESLVRMVVVEGRA